MLKQLFLYARKLLCNFAAIASSPSANRYSCRKKSGRAAFLLCMAVLLIPVSSVAGQEESIEREGISLSEPIIITYSQAVELANKSLQDMYDIINEKQNFRDALQRETRRRESSKWTERALRAFFDDYEEDMEILQDWLNDMLYRIVYLHDGTEIRTLAAAARRVLRDIEEQIYRFSLQIRQAELVVENNLRGLIVAVIEHEAVIEISEVSLSLAEENLRRITIRHNFGLASSNELRAATQSFSRAEMSLTEHRVNLYSALNRLNYFLSLPLYQYTIVEIEYGQYFLQVPECLTEHINNLIPTTPPIRPLQLDVDRDYEVLRTFRGTRERRAALREVYENTTEIRNLAKLTMEAAMRRTFNDYMNLQTRYEAQLLEQERTTRMLEIAKTNLRLGKITAFEVQQAQFTLFQAEQALASIVNQKWLLAFRLENPSLLV